MCPLSKLPQDIWLRLSIDHLGIGEFHGLREVSRALRRTIVPLRAKFLVHLRRHLVKKFHEWIGFDESVMSLLFQSSNVVIAGSSLLSIVKLMWTFGLRRKISTDPTTPISQDNLRGKLPCHAFVIVSTTIIRNKWILLDASSHESFSARDILSRSTFSWLFLTRMRTQTKSKTKAGEDESWKCLMPSFFKCTLTVKHLRFKISKVY